MKICGIDEAGRGPVIGPLVIAGVLISEADEKKLKQMGAKDSKLLTPLQRERLFDEIKKFVDDYKIIIVQPQEIDEAVESKTGENLNWLEARKTIDIIESLKPQKAIVDCPSTNPAKYKEFLAKFLEKLPIVAEHKADVTYPVVSAASILAKVTRDAEIEKIRKKYGEIGSGYPSDPITQKFIKANWQKHPEIFRKSWATYKNIAGIKSQKKIGEF